MAVLDVDALSSVLADRDPNLVRAGIQLAAHYRLGPLGAKIVPLLSHKIWQIRKAAAEALGELEYKPAEPHLARIVCRGDEANLRRHILACAALKGDPSGGSPAGDAGSGKPQQEEHWQVLKAAARALNRINPDLIETALLASLSSDNKQMVIAGMGGLAQLGSSRCASAFLPFLDHADLEVKKTAVVCLGMLAYAEAAPKLIELLEFPNAVIRKEAVIALNHIKDERAIPYLVEKLKDSNDEVRMVAAVALGNTQRGDPGLLERLKGVLEDSSAKVRGAACSALANLKAEEALDWIAPRILDRDEDVRRKAARALQDLLARVRQRKYAGETG